MEKKIYKVFSPENEITLNDGEKVYVLFDLYENGERFMVLVNDEAFIFVKEENGRLIEMTDEGEIDILIDLVEQFAEENFVLDRDNKSNLMDRLMGNEQD
ncbi:hypothetical protein FJO69_01175 [[Mycoplasma] falconis]|uniref:DUF1292 domain-containing protein n=1 Tax=[Mycoplasma] falconis TaxID=92403 RepID=A0A501XAS4_9BACT|nr:hypothetical protein [[Mycoplasma] falconis]TPE57529.1 hypothetical protein FJO69_01175 [[Mycoplasma] falconis]